MGRIGLATFILLLFSPVGIIQAGVVYNISMNTGPLIGHTAGPFSLEFQLNDGSGTSSAVRAASGD